MIYPIENKGEAVPKTLNKKGKKKVVKEYHLATFGSRDEKKGYQLIIKLRVKDKG